MNRIQLTTAQNAMSVSRPEPVFNQEICGETVTLTFPAFPPAEKCYVPASGIVAAVRLHADLIEENLGPIVLSNHPAFFRIPEILSDVQVDALAGIVQWNIVYKRFEDFEFYFPEVRFIDPEIDAAYAEIPIVRRFCNQMFGYEKCEITAKALRIVNLANAIVFDDAPPLVFVTALTKLMRFLTSLPTAVKMIISLQLHSSVIFDFFKMTNLNQLRGILSGVRGGMDDMNFETMSPEEAEIFTLVLKSYFQTEIGRQPGKKFSEEEEIQLLHLGKKKGFAAVRNMREEQRAKMTPPAWHDDFAWEHFENPYNTETEEKKSETPLSDWVMQNMVNPFAPANSGESLERATQLVHDREVAAGRRLPGPKPADRERQNQQKKNAPKKEAQTPKSKKMPNPIPKGNSQKAPAKQTSTPTPNPNSSQQKKGKQTNTQQPPKPQPKTKVPSKQQQQQQTRAKKDRDLLKAAEIAEAQKQQGIKDAARAKYLAEMICFRCQQRGHRFADCPSRDEEAAKHLVKPSGAVAAEMEEVKREQAKKQIESIITESLKDLASEKQELAEAIAQSLSTPPVETENQQEEIPPPETEKETESPAPDPEPEAELPGVNFRTDTTYAAEIKYEVAPRPIITTWRNRLFNFTTKTNPIMKFIPDVIAQPILVAAAAGGAILHATEKVAETASDSTTKATIARMILAPTFAATWKKQVKPVRIGGFQHSLVEKFLDKPDGDKRYDNLAIGDLKHDDPKICEYSVKKVEVKYPGFFRRFTSKFFGLDVEFPEKITDTQLDKSLVSQAQFLQMANFRSGPFMPMQTALNSLIIQASKTASINLPYDFPRRQNPSGNSEDLVSRTVEAVGSYRAGLVETQVLRTLQKEAAAGKLPVGMSCMIAPTTEVVQKATCPLNC